ncbi:MAG: cellulase family glycosylhydrolase [Phycisphaerae bacterium]|nr:cellulase family glycosylhydrolase [Phycisphaerae bacterium]
MMSLISTLIIASVATAKVLYNPLGVTVIETNPGVSVAGRGLTNDTLQAAYNAGGGQVSISSVNWANAPNTSTVTASNGNNHDFVFTSAYQGGRALDEIRLYTQQQTGTQRFYYFDLYYSTVDNPSTFIKFLTIQSAKDSSTLFHDYVIKGAEIFIQDFRGQIRNINTLRMSTQSTTGTVWSEMDINLISAYCDSVHLGDFSGDLQVDFSDFATFASAWLQTNECCADFDQDTQVGLDDMMTFSEGWLKDYSAIVSVAPSSLSVGKFEPVFIDIGVPCAFSNPYNPDDIRVDMHMQINSTEVNLPCFYRNGISGNSQWQGRFTPRQVGEYSCTAAVYLNGNLTASSEPFTLTVSDSDSNGFINKNPGSYYTFLYDSGKYFRGLGENVAWDPRSAYDNMTYTYEYLFPLLNAHGMNFARVWMCPWNIHLEWVNSTGLGSYEEEAASRMDEVLALAEQYGIYLELAFDYHGVLTTAPDYWGGNNYWIDNLYNTANGGPCANPAAFFSNAAAKQTYKNRLRYIVARWGYNTHICAWEFWNEVDNAMGTESIPAADITAWHNEMATYLKSIDPYGHLVSTSTSSTSQDVVAGLWSVSNIDFSQSHLYGSTSSINPLITGYENTYLKPYVVGEFAISWQGPWSGDYNDTLYKKELHMGLWRGMFSPTPVLPLTWYWDYYAGASDWWDIFLMASQFHAEMLTDSTQTISKVTLTVASSSDLEAMGLKASGDLFVWMKNKRTYVISATVKMSVANGTYSVYYYDTWTGTYSAPQQIIVTNGTLTLTISNLAADKDLACRIEKIS